MAQYKCTSCGEITSTLVDSSDTLQCAKCHSKIFSKVRQPVARRVQAR